MTKKEAQLVIDLVFKHERTAIFVIEKNVQNAVDTFMNNRKKLDSTMNYYQIKKEFELKSNSIVRMFQKAFLKKAKETVLKEIEAKKILGVVDEKKYLIPECAIKLNMTPQNLNAILRGHPEIEVIQLSARKRYLTKSQIEKIRKL